MKFIIALLILIFPNLAIAQTVTLGDTKVNIVFYVKEGTNSPYQGLLQLTPEEYASIKASDLKTKQIEQFEQWKAATLAAKNAPVVEPTADEKVARVEALRAEADAIAADPAVAAKLAAKSGVKK